MKKNLFCVKLNSILKKIGINIISLIFACSSMLFLSENGLAQPFTSMPWIKDTVYIDPNYNGNQLGTLAEPYDSIRFTFESNNAYLFKRGTVLEVNGRILVNADSIYLGAYGNGDKPIISPNSTTKHVLLTGTYQVLQNLHIKGLDDSTAVVCDFRSTKKGFNWADNLEIEHGYRGLNASDNSKIVISNTIIHDIRDDGMYTSKNDSIIIDGVEIWDINRNYLVKPDITYAGGDCIQGESNGYVHIKNSLLDHSQIGGKFALIQNGPDTVILENSVLISHEGSSAVYLGTSKRGWNINGCEIIGGIHGLWSHCEALVLNSILRGQTENGISGSANVYYCTFIDQKENALEGYSGIEFIVHNTIFYDVKQAFAADESKVTASHNNYFNPTSTVMINQWGENKLKFDPLFQDINSFNFSLKPQSSLIDKGLNFDFINHDLLLRNRINGLASDIGAIEYYSSASDNSLPIPILKFNHKVTSGFIGEVDASHTYDYNHDNLIYYWKTETSITREYTGSSLFRFIAPSFEENQKIKIKLKVSDGDNSREREIKVTVLPYKPEATELDIAKASSKSFVPNFGPENALDSSKNTYWLGSTSKEEIIMELKVSSIVDFIRLSAYLSYGEEQVFDIFGSQNSVDWQILGNEFIHSGLSDEYQVFELSDTIHSSYKYIKLSPSGNSTKSFKKVNEILIYGKEKPFEDDIKMIVFPVPAKDFALLRIFDLTMEISYVKVFDLNGKEIQSILKSSSSGDILISTKSMASGMYNIHVKTQKGEIHNSKLVVVK